LLALDSEHRKLQEEQKGKGQVFTSSPDATPVTEDSFSDTRPNMNLNPMAV
jgi:hypothetical protein